MSILNDSFKILSVAQLRAGQRKDICGVVGLWKEETCCSVHNLAATEWLLTPSFVLERLLYWRIFIGQSWVRAGVRDTGTVAGYTETAGDAHDSF